jgi:hypothetical protein
VRSVRVAELPEAAEQHAAVVFGQMAALDHVADRGVTLWGSETRPLALAWAFMRLARIR